MRALSLVLTAPFLLASDLPTVSVEAGTEVTKTFVNTLRIELVDLTVEVNGEEQDIPEEAKPEVVIEDDEEVIFVDTYTKVADGRGTVVSRTYETLSNTSTQTVTVDGEDNETVSDGESELEGMTVVFTWDGEEEEYKTKFGEDEEGDEDLLEDLEGDADFHFLLENDEDEIEVGDSWTVGASAFDRLSSPSGDLKIDTEDEDENDEFSDLFEEGLAGELEVTLASIEEGIATLEIEGEITTEIELDSEVPEGAPEDFEMSQTFEFVFDCKGTLLWDVEKGIAKSLEFGGDVTMDLGSSRAFGGNEIIQVQSFEGEFSNSATFE